MNHSQRSVFFLKWAFEVPHNKNEKSMCSVCSRCKGNYFLREGERGKGEGKATRNANTKLRDRQKPGALHHSQSDMLAKVENGREGKERGYSIG